MDTPLVLDPLKLEEAQRNLEVISCCANEIEIWTSPENLCIRGTWGIVAIATKHKNRPRKLAIEFGRSTSAGFLAALIAAIKERYDVELRIGLKTVELDGTSYLGLRRIPAPLYVLNPDVQGQFYCEPEILDKLTWPTLLTVRNTNLYVFCRETQTALPTPLGWAMLTALDGRQMNSMDLPPVTPFALRAFAGRRCMARIDQRLNKIALAADGLMMW